MSIASEISRIKAAKTALKNAINAKGGTLDGELLDDYAAAVSNIDISNEAMDLSMVTVTAGDIRQGKVAVGSDGQVITGTIATVTATQDGNTVTVPSGYIAESQSFTIESSGTDTSDATVEAGSMLAGVTAYGASGKVTGTIATVTATQDGNIVTVPSGYIAESQSFTIGSRREGGIITPGVSDQVIPAETFLAGEVTIAGDAALLAGNIRQGAAIFGVAGTFSGSGGSTVYSSTLYRCEKTYGPEEVKAYQISGCPATEYNGTYLPTEITIEGWDGTAYTVYKHESAELYYFFEPNNYMSWGVGTSYTGELVYNGSGTNWYNQNWDTVEGMASAEIWVTIKLDVPKTWDGYKAVLSNGVYTFEETLTAGLTYSGAKPEKYGIYSADAAIKAQWLKKNYPCAGLVVYAPLTDDIDTPEIGKSIRHTSSTTLGTYLGYKCAARSNIDGDTPMVYANAFVNSDEDFSVFFQVAFTEVRGANVITLGSALRLITTDDNCFQLLDGGRTSEKYSFEMNKWYDILVVKKNGWSHLYIDNVFKQSLEKGGCYLRGEVGFFGGWRNGYCRNLMVYDRALSDEEIAQLHDALGIA